MIKSKYTFPAIDIITGIAFLTVLAIAVKWFVQLLTGGAVDSEGYIGYLVFSHFGLFIFIGIMQSIIGDTPDEVSYAWTVIPVYLIIILLLIIALFILGIA